MKIKIIENTLYLLAILLICFLKAFDDELASAAFVLAGLFVLIALCLPQWEKNNYRWNLHSIPGVVQIIVLFVLCFLFLALNNTICAYRLGVNGRLVPNILVSLAVQSITLLVGAGIYSVSYPKRHGSGLSVGRTLAVIVLSGLSVYLAQFCFLQQPR